MLPEEDSQSSRTQTFDGQAVLVTVKRWDLGTKLDSQYTAKPLQFKSDFSREKDDYTSYTSDTRLRKAYRAFSVVSRTQTKGISKS